MAAKKPRGWLAAARASMKRRGTVGAFTRQARRHGASPQQYAARVLANPGAHTGRTVKRARFARTMGELGAARSGRKLPPVLKLERPKRPKVRRARRRRVKKAAA